MIYEINAEISETDDHMIKISLFLPEKVKEELLLEYGNLPKSIIEKVSLREEFK
jgi:hypothetical protein